MPMNEEVMEAMECIEFNDISCTSAWQTIRAELTRLTEIAEGVDPLVVRLGEVTEKLERANALLRKIHDAGYYRVEIDAHLSEPRTPEAE